MSARLHQLLAAESDVKDRWKKIHAESLTVLGKPEYFKGHEKSLSLTKEFDVPTKTAMEAAGADLKIVTTTVDKRLAYDGEFFGARVNHQLQKELTNQQAKADLVVDGVVIGRALPATFLLSMEQLLTERRALYAAAPTLAAGIEWIEDPQAGAGFWKGKNPDKATKTEKTVKAIELVKATEKHPAQIEKLPEDITIGLFTTVHKSGMWTSARKAEVLKRIDKLLVAVKQARAKANEQEIDIGTNIGGEILKFLEAKEATVQGM